MEKNLSYLNHQGFTVFTSEFHRKRGHCCLSYCLHCPYGLTVKKFGLDFKAVQETDYEVAAKLIGNGIKSIDFKDSLPGDVLILYLKGVVCGLVLKEGRTVKKIFLKNEFSNQGITKELVQEYLMHF